MKITIKNIHFKNLNTFLMKLFVAGSINQDILLEIERHPVVGETLSAKNISYMAGGKGANQAVAAARAGARTVFLGAVGDDEFGKSLVAGLQDEGISIDGISILNGISTGLAVVTIVERDNSIIIHHGANGKFSPKNIGNKTRDKRNNLSAGDFVLAQLETPQETTRTLFELAKEVGAICVLNPAPATILDKKLIQAADYLIVNEIELAVIWNEACHTPKEIQDTLTPNNIASTAMLLEIQSQFKLSGVICTLGKAGVIACYGTEVYELDEIPVNKVIDTTGAGDCFVGVFTAMLMQGEYFYSALVYANLAASMAIQALGAQTAMPTKDQILKSMNIPFR